MGFFDDYNAAVEAYPDTHMGVEIRNVDYPGTRLNVGEVGTFEVLIRNHGPLRVRDVILRVRGLSGVLVKHQGALSQFSPEMELSTGDRIVVEPSGGEFLIAQGSADWNQILSFQAPPTRRREQGLIEVSIMNWAVDLSVVHASHGWSAAAATYTDRVVAA
jgi:hypothetical protein